MLLNHMVLICPRNDWFWAGMMGGGLEGTPPAYEGKGCVCNNEKAHYSHSVWGLPCLAARSGHWWSLCGLSRQESVWPLSPQGSHKKGANDSTLGLGGCRIGCPKLDLFWMLRGKSGKRPWMLVKGKMLCCSPWWLVGGLMEVNRMCLSREVRAPYKIWKERRRTTTVDTMHLWDVYAEQKTPSKIHFCDLRYITKFVTYVTALSLWLV